MKSKYINFKPYIPEGYKGEYVFATIDRVYFFGLYTRTYRIFKTNKSRLFWMFAHSGAYAAFSEIDGAERAYRFRQETEETNDVH